MKVCVCVCTYLRPVELGYVIRCFQRQDYPATQREMVILDDAGQYEGTQGDRWRLISTDRRYETLGEKRNAAARLASPGADVLCQWDDDDLYLPWALSASVAALADAAWSRPTRVLQRTPDGLVQRQTWSRRDRRDRAFPGGWALRRKAFWAVGGYPKTSTNEDLMMARRLQAAGVRQADPLEFGFRPFYIWAPHGNPHLSSEPVSTGYASWGEHSGPPATVRPTDPPGIDLDHPVILPHVRRRFFGGDWS